LPSPTRFSTAETVESAIRKAVAICAAVIRSLLSRTISSTSSGGVLCEIRFGAEERSNNPAGPSSRHLAIQRRAVRSVIPAASVASISLQGGPDD
jgi:hypothetical protein